MAVKLSIQPAALAQHDHVRLKLHNIAGRLDSFASRSICAGRSLSMSSPAHSTQVLYYGTILVPITASLVVLFQSHPHLLALSSYSQERLPGLLASLLLVPLAAILTRSSVLGCADAFLSRGFKGRDLLKPWDAGKEM